MGNRVQNLKPEPSAEVKKWMKENIAEQKKRYRAIVNEMDALSPKRDKWNKEFLKIIQTEGFSVTGRKYRRSLSASTRLSFRLNA